MEWQIWFTLGIVLLALTAMVRELAAPDLILMAALLSLAAVGILSPYEVFSGFSNPVVAAVGALFMVSAALRETGALDIILSGLLGRSRSVTGGLLRITGPVAFLSAFLNNAPIVAMMTPGVIDWAHRHSLPPSRFLIPLSYASILGSTTTIIGTSTILTVAGLISEAGMPEMGFFELLPVGLPLCAVGLTYLVLVAPRFLPDRTEPGEALGDRRREYTADMLVQPSCPLVGQTVEEAGLRQLPGLFLVEIDREGRIITPVRPDQVILAQDRLVFAGVVSTIVDLQRIRGLVPAPAADDAALDNPSHRLVEVVVSNSSPLVGRSIRDSNFRGAYDAAVIGVHRNGERIPGKIGEIVLRPGDTLLMQSAPDFLRLHRNSPDFFLVSELAGGTKPRFERAGIAVAILLAVVLSVSLAGLHIAIAAFIGVGLLIATRCISATQARQSVHWPILVTIGAGLGIASALEKTGAAGEVARVVVAIAGELGAMGALVVIYAVCLLMAETLHHNAAVALMFPVAVATAQQTGADPRAFVMTVAIGSCCAFASPVAYQTHLIVYGPGGYRFTDFVRVGLPLDLICAFVALSVIPSVFPLA
ncbi:MAG: SLC13 family permease [Deltaproteobacteria bacterium]|nr:SLC13 family permease [Deltaproteobacteria bacterium]MBW2420839.1 SLC13 family permease [Deltaproteobacteria bacterium]